MENNQKRTIGVVAKPSQPRAVELAAEVLKFIDGLGLDYRIDAEAAPKVRGFVFPTDKIL